VCPLQEIRGSLERRSALLVFPQSKDRVHVAGAPGWQPSCNQRNGCEHDDSSADGQDAGASHLDQNGITHEMQPDAAGSSAFIKVGSDSLRDLLLQVA
jgi:hypothetical protein